MAQFRKVRDALTDGTTQQNESTGSVYECRYRGELAALKIFKKATEESAFKEIEITFALRHPYVIGVYAWFREQGRKSVYG